MAIWKIKNDFYEKDKNENLLIANGIYDTKIINIGNNRINRISLFYKN